MVGITVASCLKFFRAERISQIAAPSEGVQMMEALALALGIRYDRAAIRWWRARDMPKGPSAASLTGIWHGIYSYPILRAPVSFVATLIETISAVSGTTHEPCTIGGGPNDILYATLLGSRQHSAVAFVKSYDGANPHYGTVAYEGTLSPDGTEIKGRWIVAGNWSGKFLMIRPAGKTAAVGRTMFERA